MRSGPDEYMADEREVERERELAFWECMAEAYVRGQRQSASCTISSCALDAANFADAMVSARAEWRAKKAEGK